MSIMIMIPVPNAGNSPHRYVISCVAATAERGDLFWTLAACQKQNSFPAVHDSPFALVYYINMPGEVVLILFFVTWLQTVADNQAAG